MIRFDYAQLDSFKEPHMILSAGPFSKTGGRLPNGSGGNTILMSRTDFTVKIVDIPPLPEDQLANMLKYRIKALHPGDPARTVFDYRLIRMRNKTFAVLFITDREILKSYENLGKKNRLILPFNLMKRAVVHCREQNKVFLFWHRDWIDVFSIKDGEPCNANAVKRSHSIKTDLQRLKKILPKYAVPFSMQFYSSEDENSRIISGLEAVFPEISVEHGNFEDLFQTPLSRRDSLFAKKKKIRLPPLSRRLFAYASAIAALLVVLLVRANDQMYRYLDFLKDRKANLSARSNELAETRKEILKLEKEYALLEAQKPVNIYHLLSQLAGFFPQDTVIQSLIVRDEVFQIEGTGSNPLLVEEELKKQAFFQDIEITEMKPVAGSSRQSFRMKGKYRNAETHN